MGKKPVRPFGPDCHAAATMYHAGQSNAQLTTHKASLLHAEIISTVMVSAKTEAAPNETGAPCHPRRAPKIAGGRNNKKHGP
jgi:anti-sigma factor RsiW